MVEYVAAVAQGVNVGMRAEGRGGLAVGVIPVTGCNVAVDVHQPDHVALSVGDVVVDITVLQQHEGCTVLVIEEVQNIVTVSLSDQLAAGVVIGVYYTVDGLGSPQAVGIVGKAQVLTALGSSCHFPALLPGEVPAVVVTCGIANGVVGDGGTVILGQQVAPVAVTVGVGISRSVLDGFGDITCIVIGVAKISFLPGGDCRCDPLPCNY